MINRKRVDRMPRPQRTPHARVMGQISVLTFLLVLMFVVVSVVYAVIGFTDLATAALGAATGIAVGAGATSTVVHQANGRNNETVDSERPDSPPPSVG